MKRSAEYFACAAVAALMFASHTSAQSGDDDEKGVLVNNFPLPPGEKAQGFTFYDWEKRSKRSYFIVGVLERKDLEHIQMTNAKITTFDENENTDLILLLPYSAFDLKTRLLTTDRQFVLKRADFELMGDTLQLNTVTREATITGGVKMIVYNFQEPPRKQAPHE